MPYHRPRPGQKEDPIKLKGVEVVNDYHKNISWIKSKPIPLVKKDFLESAYEVSYIQICFGMYVKDSVQKMNPIRLVNRYRDRDWIFFDEVSYLLGTKKEIKAGKGVVFKITDNQTNTDVNRGISERSDVVADENAIAFIKYVLSHDTGLNIRYSSNRNNQYWNLMFPTVQKSYKSIFRY